MSNRMKITNIFKKILLSISILILLSYTASAEDVEVRVNAPEYVSDTFEVTIDIENVMNLDSGQFDLSFDPDVVNVTEVEAGNIDDTKLPVDMWDFIDNNRIRVSFNVPGAGGMDSPDVLSHYMPVSDTGGVDGSGYLTKITFTITGNEGDSCVLSLSDVSDSFKKGLVNVKTDFITTNWFDDIVIIGTNNPNEETLSYSAQITTADTVSNPTSISSITHEPEIEDVSDPTVRLEISQKDENEKITIVRSENFIAVYSIIGLLAIIYTMILLKW